jgi:hypothetical protein
MLPDGLGVTISNGHGLPAWLPDRWHDGFVWKSIRPKSKARPTALNTVGRAFLSLFFLFLETFFLFMDYCFLSSDATTLFWMPKPDHLLAKNSIAAAQVLMHLRKCLKISSPCSSA